MDAAAIARQIGKASKQYDDLLDAIEHACVLMMFGDRGSHLGVVVELGEGWSGVSLRDPDEDPRAIPGELVTIEIRRDLWRWRR